MSKGKVKKFLAVGGALTALGFLGLATGSEAAKIIVGNSTGGNLFPLRGCGGSDVLYAAYEVYGDGSSSIPTDQFTIKIEPTMMIYPQGRTVQILLTNGKFSSPSSYVTGATQFCLHNNTHIFANQTTPDSASTDNIMLNVNATGGLPVNIQYLLGVCDNNIKGNVTKIEIGRGISASCNSPGFVKIRWVGDPSDSCEADLIEIKPKVTGSVSLNFDHDFELDVDKDFKEFVNGGRTKTATISSNVLSIGGGYWVLGGDVDSKTNATGISFEIVSQFDEQGITSVRFYNGTSGNSNNYSCTKIDNKKWKCEAKNPCLPLEALKNNGRLEITVDGSQALNPTIWTYQNFSVSKCTVGPQVNAICVGPALTSGPAGVWYGGVEAIVPLVRHSTEVGATTAIKLFNRYDKPARVYFGVFGQATNSPIHLSVTPIPGKEEIPAGGTLLITGEEIKNAFSGVNWNEGQAVKISIRVPRATTENKRDPFVEGVVINTYQGKDRVIPLKFKTTTYQE